MGCEEQISISMPSKEETERLKIGRFEREEAYESICTRR